MKWIFIIVIILSGCSEMASNSEVTITETVYQGRNHFLIETSAATYFYDKTGGGFSRILDNYGNDWVAFSRDSVSSYPGSAGSSYRGLPNLVFGGEDNGAGHPGFDQCRSQKVSNNSIQSESLNGQWD